MARGLGVGPYRAARAVRTVDRSVVGVVYDGRATSPSVGRWHAQMSSAGCMAVAANADRSSNIQQDRTPGFATGRPSLPPGSVERQGSKFRLDVGAFDPSSEQRPRGQLLQRLLFGDFMVFVGRCPIGLRIAMKQPMPKCIAPRVIDSRVCSFPSGNRRRASP
jgi:hypothetical protein